MTDRRFPIREGDRRVFDAIRAGSKRVETRAASPRYRHVEAGDTAIFDCGKDTTTRTIVAVRPFPSVSALVSHYGVRAIIPWLRTKRDLIQLYGRFHGYREKIAQYGIVAFELR